MEITYDEFIRDLPNCCEKSICERSLNEPEYLEAYEEYQKLFQIIGDRLGDTELLSRLEAATNAMDCVREDHIFELAFRECIYILRWLKLL